MRRALGKIRRFIATMIPLYHGKRGAKSKARVCKELEHRAGSEGWLKTTKLIGMGRSRRILVTSAVRCPALHEENAPRKGSQVFPWFSFKEKA